MSAKRGFLLLEIMIALTFFATVSIIIAHYYCRIITLQNQSRTYCQAVNIARTMFESITNEKSIPREQPVHVDNFDVTWKVSDSLLSRFKAVVLSIAWQSCPGRSELITVTSGFFINESPGEGK